MGRPAPPPGSLLGAELQLRRAGRPSTSVSAEIGVTYMTWLRLEKGSHRPSYDTAVKVARWLHWTTEQVMAASVEPAPLKQLVQAGAAELVGGDHRRG